MKICFVTPRYGTHVVGGAERQALEYAERLAAVGHDLTVLTTCARNHFTWKNELPVGETVVNGVRVHRFPVTRPSDVSALDRLEGILSAGGCLTREEEEEWALNKGHSEALLEEIVRLSLAGSVLVFTPYLFPTTIYGAAVSPDRSIIIPCLHDESYARFASVRKTVCAVAGLIFNTDAESLLAQQLLGSLPPHRTVGFGFDAPPSPDVRSFRARHRMTGDYVAYAGRHEIGKNFPLLLQWITAYGRVLSPESPAPLLVMGSGDYTLPALARDLVSDIGFVSPQEKFAGLAAATVLANLSLNESFSHVLAESWLVGTPVIVHKDCPVTVEHCVNSSGGLWVDSVEMFAACVERLRRDHDLRSRLGSAGRSYVEKRYSWSAVLGRLTAAIADLTA